MLTKDPLVSIVITSYNYGAYIKEAIESVYSQTYKNVELIIIDDGSTDGSIDTIKGSIKEKQATLISRENKGIVFTRNQAFDIIAGKYLCFLDADDYFNKDYVEKMVKVAEETSADVVYPNWHVFGDNKYTREFSDFDVQKLIRQEIHCTSESLIRVSSLKGHKFESEKIAEDWDLFLGMALSGKKFVHAKDCYINYRVREHTRGTSHPYWDDVYEFCNILLKWQKKYPKIVNPFDLPIHAGKERDAHIKSQDRIISDLKHDIGNRSNEAVEMATEIDRLKRELSTIKGSQSYKIGRTITAPVRKLRGSINGK
jgi:glycosyltransferase involved in cell wall biosynthesis